MEYTVCSREFERDFTWDNTHASHSFAESAQGLFAPALEGSLTTSRIAALLRCSGSQNGVILGVSVSTKRIDFRHRPIRTMAFLRAENPDEEKLLASFFAECLRKSDVESLYAAGSGVTKAIESLYQAKKSDEFLAFCKSLKPVAGKGGAPENRWAIPRNDEGERKSLADVLPAAIAGDSPFLFALTDRLPTDVLASLGSMFDRGAIRIFSKATTAKEPIPGGPPNTRAVATAIGGAVILALLVAAIGPCSRKSGGGGAFASTNSLGRAVESRVVATNAQASIGFNATNTVQTEGRSIEPAGETRPGGVSSNAAPASSETSAAVTNNPAESPAIRNGKAK